MTARQATPDDAEELVRLREVMLRSMTGREWDDAWREPALRTLREKLGAPEPTLVAIVVDRPEGGLAACALGTIEQRLGSPGNPFGRSGYVFSVATDVDRRRRGHARECLTELLKWFRDRDIPVVDLRASEDGIHLYESLGFTRTSDPALRLRF